MARYIAAPKRIFGIWYLCILIAIFCLHSSTNADNNNTNSLAIAQISTGSERFALELLQRLSQILPEDYDYIISPFSIWSLLILTAEGSSGNTYTQLQNVLGLPNDLTYIREGYKHIQRAFRVNTTTVELALNQVMFTDENRPIDNEFSDRLVQVYEADTVTVNFHDAEYALNFINDYIISKTNGKLGKRVVHLNDLTDAQMMLISAIYFKGQWHLPFNVSQTQPELFYNEAGQALGYVDMMYQTGEFGYTSIAQIESHVLELQYGKQHRLSMIILLPKKGVSLASVLQRLQTSGTQLLINELERAKVDYSEDEVEVYLPRLSITSDLTLNQVLKDMGLLDIFSADLANLEKISKHAYLSRLIHKAKLEVNEEGTIASAATAGAFANKNTPPRFYANRPFAYLIIEKTTNIVLFCGAVKNPIKK